MKTRKKLFIALLSLSEQKNEDTNKIVYHVFGSYLIFDITWNPENEY